MVLTKLSILYQRNIASLSRNALPWQFILSLQPSRMTSISQASITATVRAVKPKKLSPQRAPLTLTEPAIKKIKALLEEKPGALGLKIGVRTRGCNGLSYTLDYATEKAKFDEVIEQDGVRVLIDAKAQMSLLGTEMDYSEDILKSEFIFNNPNIKGTCGCGESFNV